MQGDVDVASRATIQAFRRQGAPRLLIPSVSPVLCSVGRRHTRGARHHRTQQRPLVEPSECRSVAVRIGFVGERPNRGGVMSRVGGLLFLAIGCLTKQRASHQVAVRSGSANTLGSSGG